MYIYIYINNYSSIHLYISWYIGLHDTTLRTNPDDFQKLWMPDHILMHDMTRVSAIGTRHRMCDVFPHWPCFQVSTNMWKADRIVTGFIYFQIMLERTNMFLLRLIFIKQLPNSRLHFDLSIRDNTVEYRYNAPERRQPIIWTNAGILLIGPLGTNFSEILIEILTFSLEKMRSKVSSAKRRPFCLGLNLLSKRGLGSSLQAVGSGAIPENQGQYHRCWCPGSLRRLVISSREVDYVEQTDFVFYKNYTTCAPSQYKDRLSWYGISIWR